MRSTAAEGFRLMALFVQGESFGLGEVQEALGWGKTKAHDHLGTAVEAGFLERVGEGRAVRYRLAPGFRDAVRKGLERHERLTAAELIRRRGEEIVRAVQVQAEHLVNELMEVI